MSTNAGQDRILNPQDKEPILKVPWQPFAYTEEIKSRIADYAVQYLNSRDIIGKFMKIKEDLWDLYKTVSSKISDMEHDWLDELNDDSGTANMEENEAYTLGEIVGVLVGISPIWMTVLAVGMTLTVTLGNAKIPVSTVLLPLMAFLGREERKKEIIAEVYANCKSTIRDTVCNQLWASVGCILTKIVNKVIELAFRRIESFRKMTEQLSESRDKILAHRDVLLNLAQKVELMIENAKKIQEI